MDPSGGRLNATAEIPQHPIFNFSNSISEFVLNDNKNEELNWGSFNFKNGTENSTQFLDSPSFVFNSNMFSSPTTGNYPIYDFKEESTNVFESDFQQQTVRTTIFGNKMEGSINSQVLNFNDRSQPKEIDLSIKKFELKSEKVPQKESNFGTFKASEEKDRFDDGYNWRKYGQKQVKGSNKPRSYFKCSYPNCPTKKKVEKDFNGYITQIIYKGKHNHPVPQNKKKTSLNSFQNAIFEYTLDKNRFESFSQNPSASIGESNNDQDFSVSEADDDTENEPKSKKWKLDEGESEAIWSRTLQEPKVVIETRSEIDILDDGYKWRKYGQKVIKGNPNPRSYYKCINIGCPVRKLVERASHDLHVVVTTYEAKHNHGVPIPRGGGRVATHQPLMTNTNKTSSNHMPLIPRPLPNYSYNVHGMRGLTTRDVQTPYTMQTLENSIDIGSLESSLKNHDRERVILSAIKEELENELMYNLL